MTGPQMCPAGSLWGLAIDGSECVGNSNRYLKEPSIMNLSVQRTLILALALILGVCTVARAADGTLLAPVKVTFTVAAGSLKLMDAMPEVIGVAGNRAPLRKSTEYPPSLLLRAVKGSRGLFSGTLELPEKTGRDLTFNLMFRVEGLWQKEPNNLGLAHVVLLDPKESAQEVCLVYDATLCRFVGDVKKGLTVDGFQAAAAFALSLKQSDLARQYEYCNAVALLGSGKVVEAVGAYNRYTAAAPKGALAREGYDNFSVLQAMALAKSGKGNDAINTLRSVPTSAGGAKYQVGVQLALGQLLLGSGKTSEARSVLSELQKRAGVAADVKDECAYAVASSCLRDSTLELRSQGKQLLRSLASGTASQTTRRSALLALAQAELQSSDKNAAKVALKQASMLGTSEQRLSVQMKLLEMQYADGDYAGVHKTCDWILTDGTPGRHRAHMLCLDAVSLKRAGKTDESRSQLKKLLAEFPGSAYAAYATALIAAPEYHPWTADSLAKGATHQ
jgi:TolA-binding protein